MAQKLRALCPDLAMVLARIELPLIFVSVLRSETKKPQFFKTELFRFGRPGQTHTPRQTHASTHHRVVAECCNHARCDSAQSTTSTMRHPIGPPVGLQGVIMISTLASEPSFACDASRHASLPLWPLVWDGIVKPRMGVPATLFARDGSKVAGTVPGSSHGFSANRTATDFRFSFTIRNKETTIFQDRTLQIRPARTDTHTPTDTRIHTPPRRC